MAGYDFFLSLSMSTTEVLALIIPLLCLVSMALHAVMYNKQKIWPAYLSVGLFLVVTVLAVMVWQAVVHTGSQHTRVPWLSMVTPWSSVQLGVGIYITDVAALMLVVVSVVTLLVHLFSIGYMQGDEGFNKYFAFLGFFAFSMYGIVLADNLLLIFFFWELVGLSSYLLIGFWYQKKEAVLAAKKAFLVNRVGDIGFLVGLMVIWWQWGTFDLEMLAGVLQGVDESVVKWITLAGIGLFLGAVGKSAQFPLQLWLPDAMEGPTPVSALIHAATMVAAGVYLLARVFFMLSPDALLVIAYTGAFTAFFAAFAALWQNDIKKVLAYSTISQLGYMVTALGMGDYIAGLFHLFTHAFFKAGLFLAAGAIIHHLHHLAPKGEAHWDAQDMRNMGGLRKSLPLVHATYVVFALSLMGVPLFSGFLSKEAVLMSAFAQANQQGGSLWLVPILCMATVGLTAFYMVRQWYLVFWAPPSFSSSSKGHVPWVFSLPLGVLALLSLGFVFSYHPFQYTSAWLYQWMDVPLSFGQEGKSLTFEGSWIALLSVGMLALGGAISYWAMKKNWVPKGWVHKVSFHQWYVDSLYQALGHWVNLSGRILHRIDTLVVDKLVNLLGVSQVVVAHMAGWVDRVMVDGVVNGLASGAGRWGRRLASLQQGVIHLMLWFSLAALLLVFIWMMIF
jgi:NADH-quinone oxidoreductase subunit L